MSLGEMPAESQKYLYERQISEPNKTILKSRLDINILGVKHKLSNEQGNLHIAE